MRYLPHHRGVEDAGHDVIFVEVTLRHTGGYGPSRRKLHLVVDLPGPDVQDAPEQAREAERVVDLVGIVGAPRRHHSHVIGGVLRPYLRVGVRHGEHDGVPVHELQVILVNYAGCGEADEQIGPGHRLHDASPRVVGVGRSRKPRLGLIVAIVPAPVQNTLAVEAHDVPDTGRDEQLRRRKPTSPHTGDDHLEAIHLFVHQPDGIQQTGQDDHGGPMLVVVEHRDVQLFAKPPLDVEAAGSGDVFEVDAAEARREVLHGGDDLVGVLGVQGDGPGVHAGELLEEERLALHDRERGRGPDVSKAQHGRSVCDHSDGVTLTREVPR